MTEPRSSAWARSTTDLWRPPPKLKLSEWADQNFHMSAEDGGKWRTLPHQRAIMDALVDPQVETVTLMKSARVGYTKMITALVAYHIAHDPCSLLVVQPTVEDAEGYSKKEIAGAIRNNEVLHGRVRDPRSRDSGNTILAKEYSGCTLWMTGANSGRGFRRIHARKAICDEVDGYPVSAGTEGDPIDLAHKRTEEARIDRKLILGSTPLNRGSSRIEKSFQESSREHYFVPCPHCKHEQRLEWGGKDQDYGIKFDRESPLDAWYLCARCHAQILHEQKLWMLDRGEWIAEAPEIATHRGFHLWTAYSVSPNATWGHIAAQFVRVHKDPQRLKTWVNTWRGETYEETGEGLDGHWLSGRREPYPSANGRIVIPAGAAALTAAVDVQDGWFAARIDAWSPAEEWWTIDYRILHLDPSAIDSWREVDALLTAPWRHQLGGDIYIRAAGIDTGGHHTQAAYNYCRPRYRRTLPDGSRQFVFALKGMAGGSRPIWPPAASVNNIGRVRLFMVGVDQAKAAIYARLKVRSPGPGYAHFPIGVAWCDDEFFEQQTAEHVVTDDRGKRSWAMRSGVARNEPLDTAAYSYAALQGAIAFGLRMDREMERVRRRGADAADSPQTITAPQVMAAPTAAAAPAAVARSRRSRGVIKSSWMSR